MFSSVLCGRGRADFTVTVMKAPLGHPNRTVGCAQHVARPMIFLMTSQVLAISASVSVGVVTMPPSPPVVMILSWQKDQAPMLPRLPTGPPR